MAKKYCRFRLPPLKVTMSVPKEKVIHEDVPRKCMQPGSRETIQVDSDFHSSTSNGMTNICENPGEGEHSMYKIQQQTSVIGWESLRPDMMHILTEANAMPKDKICAVCRKDLANFHCLRCGTVAYYFISCLRVVHNSHCNMFHVPGKLSNSR